MSGISGINTNTFFGGLNSQGASTLFGSLGKTTGVSSLSSVLTDYKTIQTGNYGKLLKAYYGQDTHSAARSSSAAKSLSRSKEAESSKNSLSDTKYSMDKLSEAASALSATGSDSLFNKKEIRQADGTTRNDYDVDAIYKGVVKFVDSYNDAVSTASKSDNRSIASGADSLTSTTEVMGKSLQRFGITSNLNGKLTVDEKTFKNSDMDRFKAVMNGRQAYASNVASTASRISSTSTNKLSSLSASTYGRKGSYSDTDVSSLFNGYF